MNSAVEICRKECRRWGLEFAGFKQYASHQSVVFGLLHNQQTQSSFAYDIYEQRLTINEIRMRCLEAIARFFHSPAGVPQELQQQIVDLWRGK